MVKGRMKKMTVLFIAGIISCGMITAMAKVERAHAAGVSSDEAQIWAGKTLTINGTKFPDVEKFDFELVAVEGYTNPNASSSADGQKITAGDVPMPEGASGNKAVCSVGNFKNAAEGDTASVRSRKNSFGNIRYNTAGYYLYKMTEIIPEARIAGVVYDESSYFVVVYVVNNIDQNGNTVPGVHVESVTAWHNGKGSDINRPNLADIAYNGKANGDDNTGDNKGRASKTNSTYGTDPAGEQRWDDLGKTGKSSDPDPSDPNNVKKDRRNVLDAYKFWNRQEMHDISIIKNVKGNLGDRKKQFEFTVTMHGLERGGTYSVIKTGAAALISAVKGSVSNSAGTFTADNSGDAVFLVKIADDQGIMMKDIPNAVTYQLSEAASNHAPSYTVTSSNKSAKENEKAVIVRTSDSTSGEKETALATAVETVNSTDENITVAFTNERDLETLTGIPDMLAYYGCAGLAAVMMLLAVKRKKNDALWQLEQERRS